jgi:hypothetical protein
MGYTVKKVDVWMGEIDDKVGGLAAKLEPLAAAGVDLGFLIARRQPHLPGKGVVFLGPVTGAKAAKTAKGVGLAKTTELAALQLDGPNVPGACAKITRTIADAGINLRGVSASQCGSNFVVFLAFDTADDATRAGRLLRSAGKK